MRRFDDSPPEHLFQIHVEELDRVVIIGEDHGGRLRGKPEHAMEAEHHLFPHHRVYFVQSSRVDSGNPRRTIIGENGHIAVTEMRIEIERGIEIHLIEDYL